MDTHTHSELARSAQAITRRRLLKTGLLGSLVLSTAHLSACSGKALKSPYHGIEQSPYTFLTKADALMLCRLFPAMMAQHWPTETREIQHAEVLMLSRLDTFLQRLGHFNQSEIRKLFDLLQFGPARGLTTGIWRGWEHTTTADVEAFLQRWKSSRFSLFTSGYNALSDIICFTWYSHPVNTRSFGYSGPPQAVLDGLPQFQTQASHTQAAATRAMRTPS